MIRGEIRLYHVVKNFTTPGTPGLREHKEKVYAIYEEEFYDE